MSHELCKLVRQHLIERLARNVARGSGAVVERVNDPVNQRLLERLRRFHKAIAHGFVGLDQPRHFSEHDTMRRNAGAANRVSGQTTSALNHSSETLEQILVAKDGKGEN